ncbi:ABC transporter permease [Fulvivirga sp.]|uniref:ABC transporter permease n=1 Tax=Fulvivirga sp. TaxID=1931237 RepID=UPI0032F07476
MFKNLIKVAIRNLLKHKSYSIINIAGLAGSIAVTILILIYAQSILTYDQFHTDSDQIYFMYRDRPTEDGRLDVFDTWYPLVDVAKEEFPTIAEGTRSVNIGNTMIQRGDKRFEQSLTYADSNFFDVFSFPMIKGDPLTALNEIDAVIISEEVANKFFGDEDPIGKTLTFGFNNERVVTGVLGKIPSNSSFTFECIVPMNDRVVHNWVGENLWGGSFCNSFIKLKAGADDKQLADQLHILMDKYVVEQERGDFLILPIKDYFDKMTGQKQYAYIMLIVAFGILFIAIINFANLSTSQSLLRTKEVGVRKVLGAKKGGLISQFIGESMIMSLIALLLGGLLAELLLPTFNDLIGIQLDIIYSPINLLLMLTLALAIGFISGSYPALFVSRMKSVSIFKGDKVSGKMTVRNLLVSIQFILAIALMGSLGIIMQQIDFMKSHDLNFDQDNVMVVPLSLRDFEDPQAALPRVVSFRNELKKLPGVEAVTGSSSVPGNYRRSFTLFLPKGKEDMPPLDWQVAVVDHDFFNTYGVDVLEGRSYIQGSANDFEHGVILNRTAMEQIGWTSIEGKKLLFPRSREELDIVGLVEDFNVQSLRDPVQPLVHYYGGDSARSYRFISIKLNPKSRESTLASIASTWEKMDFGLTYEYYFPAERFRDLYETEENIANVLTYAMILAIVISCLGLYALASFSVMLKTKEIAIRKVLGASISSIITSFSKQYLYVVLASAIPAVVISWYGMSDWLLDFAYRINIGPTVYIWAILSASIIAFITVSYHALKAGVTNPVDSLKEE